MRKNILIVTLVVAFIVSVAVNLIQATLIQRERATGEAQHELLVFKQQELEKCQGK